MTTDVVKIERNSLPMAVDEITNDASVASCNSVTGPTGVGSGNVAGNVAGTPKESAKSQNLRRTIAKPTFEKDKCSFLNDLHMFHEKHGTTYLKLPKISGKDVDLHKLYSIVIGRGGWMKVNAREDWDEVIEELDLPTRCVNNEIALKQIYIRYLDRYERVNFHGEDKDPIEDDDDEKRLHRRWSVRMLHSTPSVYNHHQHNVAEGLRSSLKLSDDLYRASEYDKLILSLLSPLPNEQDFAINVCTLMSNENKHTLKVDKCPRLVYALLAHAGVFNHFSLRDTFDEYYSNIRKNSLQRFWKECLIEKPQVLELSLEDCFAKMGTDPSALIASIYPEEPEEMDTKAGNENEDENESDFEIMNGRLNTATLRSFLSLGTGLGTNDYIGQRVLQIASIFRNLSFNEENLHVLGRNRTFIRFLIMCANSRWNNLHHLGLDMLGNIANEIDINDPQSDEVTRCLVSTLSEGLEGADRGVIISCMEVLSKIAQKESNEENLNRCLNQQLYDQISLFLCLNDIMLLLYTLECIYSLTSMGEKPCNAIMHIRGVIDTLVSLVTVEAQSYGPDACILMRVVETIPGNMATHHAQGTYYQNATGQVGQPNPPPTMTQLTVHKDGGQLMGAGGQQNSNTHVVYPTPELPKLPSLTITSKPVPSPPVVQQQQQQAQPQQHIVQPAPQTVPPNQIAANNAQIVSVTRPPAADSPQIPVNVIARTDPALAVAHGTVPNQQTATTTNVQQTNQGSHQQTVTAGGAVIQSPSAAPTSIAAKHIQQQQAQESEQFAYAWLRASFEAAPAVRMEQQELYKLYLATNGKLGRKVIVPLSHFPRCVRAVFGGTVGPVQLKMEQNGVETIGYYYEGLRLRSKPLPIVHKGTVLQQHQYIPSTPSSPLLQQVLSGDQKNNVIVVNQTTISPQLAGTGHNNPGPSAHLQTGTGTTTIMNQSGTISSTTTNPSALIKSLLANKVTTAVTDSTLSAATVGSAAAAAAAAAAAPYSSSLSTTTITNSPTTNCLIAPNVNVHQVAQRQQMQKQKQMIEQKLLPNSSINPSVVVTSNNPNNLTNIKVGNSTISIKPGTLPTNTVITATNPHETSFNAPPPLAPLSQPGIQQGTIIKTIAAPHDPNQHHTATTGKLLPNKVLSELLEKKPGEMIIAGETTIKRKFELADTSMEPPMKRMEGATKTADLYAELAGSITEGEDVEDADIKAAQDAEQQLAGKVKLQQISHHQHQQQQQQQQQHQQQQQQQQQQMISMPVSMQRQLIVTPNSAQPMIISTPAANVTNNPTPQQLTSQTTATIKTESGFQTVPIILQHNAIGGGTLQLQKATAPGGAIMQPSVLATQHQQPTQYILATNPQGQTYVMAQQPQPQPQLQQTVLLAQGQQHGGSGQKTFIIVQQQQPAAASPMPQMTMQGAMAQNQGQTQKIFLNQQGQQILMTQLPRQVIVSHGGPSVSGGTTIHTSSAPSVMPASGTTMIATAGGSGGTIIEKKPIYITTNAQGNTISFEGPPQQLQVQAMQSGSAGGTFQIKPYGNVGVHGQQQHIIQQANLSTGGSVGQQTIQFIQHQGGGTLVQAQGQLPSTTQSMQPTQQIVFHGTHSGGAVGPQIIQQQIIQSAAGSQHGQHIVQKVLHQQPQQQQQQQQLQHQPQQQHMIHAAIKQNPSQIITVQQQKQPVATITTQHTQQLPPSLSIQRQAGSSSQSSISSKPVSVANVNPPVVQAPVVAPTPGLPGGKPQIIQVVQQKLTTASGNQTQAVAAAVGQQHIRPTGPNVPPPMVASSSVASQGTVAMVQTNVTQTIVTSQPAAASHTSPMPPSVTMTSISTQQPSGSGNVPTATVTSATANIQATVNAAQTPSVATATAPAASGPITNTITIPISVATGSGSTTTSIQMIPAMDPQKIVEEDVDPSWPWVCDWRGCPRKKFQSATEVFRHACTVHCPDTVDVSADIYCQWGLGPNLCDNLPRKRFSLMTHILDRHCTVDSFKAAVQRRLAGGPQQPVQPYPVTLVRQSGPGNGCVAVANGTAAGGASGERGSPTPASCTKVDTGSTEGSSNSNTNGPGQLSAAGPAAMHAIKRYSMDYVNSKEFQDEMEGPVTKSIRLTSALILRNLVVYTNSAKRSLRMYEAHLAGVALSNVESSRTVAQLLFEMNDTGPNY
uniref:ARID domain-containing protein n=1 Tax=Anopheles funestus TaxID=62324 RepID=A0A182R9U1_ANOFN